MKQVVSNYSYSPATNVVTLTGVNIDQDQLLLVVAPQVGRTMYNFASGVTGAVSAGADTRITLNASTAGLTTTSPLVIFYDDQQSTQTVSGTVTISNLPANQAIYGTVTASLADVTDPAQDSGTSAKTVAVKIYNVNGLPISDSYRFPISGSVTIGAGISQIGTVTVSSLPASTVTVSSLPAISGTVTVGNSVTIGSCVTHGVTIANTSVTVNGTFYQATQPVSLASVPTHGVTLASTTVTVSSLPALAAGTAQIGSVTASISGTVPVSISSVTVGNSVTIGSLPAISGTVTANLNTGVTIGGTISTQSIYPVAYNTTGGMQVAGVGSGLPVSGSVTLGAGTSQIGSVTASVSNSITIGNVVTISNVQGTSVTTSNFTSTTASTTIASQNNSRRGLTIFNEGAGNLHICAGSTSTTISYQVRLLAGDYWECPLWQTSLTHSAQFASAGTARVTEIT